MYHTAPAGDIVAKTLQFKLLLESTRVDNRRPTIVIAFRGP
jgi:hypothetical protein